MKFHVMIDGRTAQLDLASDRFHYQSASGGVSEGGFTIAASGPGIYSVLINGRSYSVTAGARSAINGNATGIRVSGRVFEVEIFDPREASPRRNAAGTEGRQMIASPMPGKVVRVLAHTDSMVEAGQGVIVVEAMKMQNEMKSLRAGRVTEVRTSEGATVAAGEVLVVIE